METGKELLCGTKTSNNIIPILKGNVVFAINSSDIDINNVPKMRNDLREYLNGNYVYGIDFAKE